MCARGVSRSAVTSRHGGDENPVVTGRGEIPMRNVRLFVTAVMFVLSLGAVMVTAGSQGSGHPMAGIEGTGAITAAR